MVTLSSSWQLVPTSMNLTKIVLISLSNIKSSLRTQPLSVLLSKTRRLLERLRKFPSSLSLCLRKFKLNLLHFPTLATIPIAAAEQEIWDQFQAMPSQPILRKPLKKAVSASAVSSAWNLPKKFLLINMRRRQIYVQLKGRHHQLNKKPIVQT